MYFCYLSRNHHYHSVVHFFIFYLCLRNVNSRIDCVNNVVVILALKT